MVEIDKYEKSNFKKIVLNSKNLSDICRNLNLPPTSGNRKTVKKYIEKYNLAISHFKYEAKTGGNFKKKDLKDILVENSSFGTSNLRERLYKEGLKERVCELCGQDEMWRGKKMSLRLDHINGINNDHRLKNLRVICPNCDATLDTFCGRNNNSKYKAVYIKNIKKTKKCSCGEVIDRTSKQCKRCASISMRKTERPDLEILLKEVNELGYCATGKKYGVSDNAIRKWIKQYQKIDL